MTLETDTPVIKLSTPDFVNEATILVSFHTNNIPHQNTIFTITEKILLLTCVTKNATIHTSQNACLHQNNLGKSIFSVTLSSVTFLQIAELEEMCRPMILMVVLPRCAQFHSISHTYSMLHPHEIIIPRSIIRYLLKQKNKKTKKQKIKTKSQI